MLKKTGAVATTLAELTRRETVSVLVYNIIDLFISFFSSTHIPKFNFFLALKAPKTRFFFVWIKIKNLFMIANTCVLSVPSLNNSGINLPSKIFYHL